MPFDRIVFQAFRPLDADWAPIDRIALTKAFSNTPPAVGDGTHATMRIACDGKATKISRLIYGFAGTDSALHGSG